MPTMRYTAVSILALFSLAGCGRKGARSSDFDSATAAALGEGGAAGAAADQPKVAHIMGFELGHGLDRHNLVFGGTTEAFAPGDSILISVRSLAVAPDADIGVRLRLKNKTVDSTAAKAGAPDSTGVTNTGVRFGPQKVPGSYQVDVFLAGKYQMSKDFKVGQ